MDAELVSLLSDMAIGVSAVIVASLAVFGVRTWRRELTGRAKFEVARNVMLHSFKVKNDFQRATTIWTDSAESVGRIHKENESRSESEVLDEWYARDRRLQPLAEDLQKLQTVGWEAEILLGEDSGKKISEAVKTFRQSYGELASAIESYFEERYKEAAGRSVNMELDWLKELRTTIYSVSGGDLLKRIDEATAQLTSILKAYVK